MPEGFDAVNKQHRNLVAVSRQQIQIGFDVDFGQRIQLGATGPLNLSFHFLAEMAAGFGVNNQLYFFGHAFLSINLIGSASSIIRLPFPPRKLYKSWLPSHFIIVLGTAALLVKENKVGFRRDTHPCVGGIV